jgi:hypothetical protein
MRCQNEHVWGGPLQTPPLQELVTQQVLPQQPVLVQPQVRGRSARPQPRWQTAWRQDVSHELFGVQQAPLKQTPPPAQAVGQQNLPPLPSATQWRLVHSPSAVHAWPLSSLTRQVPLKHHRPGPHVSPAGQLPQLVGELQ